MWDSQSSPNKVHYKHIPLIEARLLPLEPFTILPRTKYTINLPLIETRLISLEPFTILSRTKYTISLPLIEVRLLSLEPLFSHFFTILSSLTIFVRYLRILLSWISLGHDFDTMLEITALHNGMICMIPCLVLRIVGSESHIG